MIGPEFDIRVNKNPFAVHVPNATNAVTIPAPGQSTYGEIMCTIDKKNLEPKKAPSNPFMVQIAIKT